MSLCIVSAFLDIGRGEWTVFRRSLKQYFINFLPYTRFEHEMIVFMDDRHIGDLSTLCENAKNITLIPINRDWMQENIHAYQQLSRETEIMESEEFKTLVSHRLLHPECCKPEYNIMQHAKIDFVSYTIINKLSQADYFAWSDFGYFQSLDRIPERSLDITKFNLEKINFQGMSELSSQDFDIMYTLTHAPERVGGFFYIGNPNQLLEYQELYHQVCKEFHDMGIVDDDQHIMIQCIAKQPSLFAVPNLRAWHVTYLYYQKDPTI
jgi:hypothetical protein